MKSYNEFIITINNSIHPDFDVSRFDYMIEQIGDCVIDNVSISSSKISSIRRFYEDTNSYNRSKIMNLINTNIRNIDKVHKLVIDYEKLKQQRDI